MDEKAQGTPADKVIAKACKWSATRLAKARATGPALTKAQSAHRQSEHELAEAVEKYQKSDR